VLIRQRAQILKRDRKFAQASSLLRNRLPHISTGGQFTY
jgi:hypothetical protein